MQKETPKVKSPIGMLVMTVIVIACVGYLFWQTISAYLAGGENAPTLTTVILGGVLLGAGSIYIAVCAIRIFIRDRKDKQKEKSEASA